MSDSEYWQLFLNRSWTIGIFRAKRELLRILATGVPLDRAVVEVILKDLSAQTLKAEAALANISAGKVLGSGFGVENIMPLQSMLRERERLLNQRLGKFRYLLEEDGQMLLELKRSGLWEDLLESVKIGRRQLAGGSGAMVRELSLRTIEEAFLKGRPTTLTKKVLIEQIPVSTQSRLFRLVGKEPRGKFYEIDIVKEIARKTHTLSENGKLYFELETYPYNGKFRKYRVDQYAELVAKTTVHEATQVSHIEKAQRIGTSLVKFNSTGRNYAQIQCGCEKVDGKIFSTIPGGSRGQSGKLYPYFRDVLQSLYLTVHVNCGHMARPYAEELA